MDQGDGDLMASSMIGDYEVVGSIPDAYFFRELGVLKDQVL